ncbi:hypothetical protein V1277_005739 [Bradyrhizobium sp. AZCC 1588]|jgi:hypothetical protein
MPQAILGAAISGTGKAMSNDVIANGSLSEDLKAIFVKTISAL